MWLESKLNFDNRDSKSKVSLMQDGCPRSGGSWLSLIVGPAKQLLKNQKSSIHRLPKFKGGVNKFLTKNAIFNTNLYLY